MKHTSNGKPTPGPWEARNYRVFAFVNDVERLRIVAYARGLNQRERTPEDEANALLIAQAPALLEALQGLVIRYTALFDLYVRKTYTSGADSDLELTLSDARYAIAKATGCDHRGTESGG